MSETRSSKPSGVVRRRTYKFAYVHRRSPSHGMTVNDSQSGMARRHEATEGWVTALSCPRWVSKPSAAIELLARPNYMRWKGPRRSLLIMQPHRAPEGHTVK